MALLRPNANHHTAPFARGGGVLLRPLNMSDYGRWAELRAMSREHLMPWEPRWARDELSRSAFRERLRHYQREARQDLGHSFAILRECDSKFVGGISLSNLRRGVTQAACVGYWLGAPYTGQGLMTAAVKTLCAYAFESLRLHRLEAASMPANVASIAVLKRTGFQPEGLARNYLMIDGRWCDHLLFARLCDDPVPEEARS